MFNGMEAMDGKMKKSVLWVLMLLMIFLGAKTVTEFLGWQFVGADTPVMSTISVSGEGEVFAVPDVATFTYTTSVERVKTAKEAQDEGARISNLADEYLKENGVDKKDIKTVNYSLQPQYKYVQIVCITFPCNPREQEFDGFTLTHSVQVKVRDIDSAGDIISGITSVGDNKVSVGGLSFTIDDEDALKEEARELAIYDAKSKAKALTKDLGVRLVRVVNFNEYGGGDIYRASYESFGFGGDGAVSQVPKISVGENRIVSNVNVTYEIR